jgi:hypothetical protein
MLKEDIIDWCNLEWRPGFSCSRVKFQLEASKMAWLAQQLTYDSDSPKTSNRDNGAPSSQGRTRIL